jgi:hypothetical protein
MNLRQNSHIGVIMHTLQVGTFKINFMPDAAGAATAKRRFSKTENISDRRFEHFFKGLSTRFGRRLLEKVLKTTVRNVFRFSKIFVWEYKFWFQTNVVAFFKRFSRMLYPLWRAKKSHFQASVESGMKNVDKNNR